ncbi:MAG: protein kinase [Terrimesophilobacter sp.]
MIGGYRLVRLLGFGARAEVYLGHAGTDASGAARVAAVKLYRPGVERHSVDTELEALGRPDSPHVLRLQDVATDRSGMPAAIVQRLEADNLTHLLIGRKELAAGEAVTILAPLVQAVAQLHRVGVAHGAVRLSNVLFDSSGGPVLAGLGAATLIGANPARGEHSLTAAQLSCDSAARGDLRDLALLCARVLDRTRRDGSRRDGLSGFLNDFLESVAKDADVDARAFPDDLADRLFTFADPLPVSFTSRNLSSTGQSPPQTRLPLAAALQPVSGSEATHHARHRRAPDGEQSAVAVRARTGVLSRVPLWLLTRLRRFRFRRLRVHRPVWVAGAVGVAVLVGALALIPPHAPPGGVMRGVPFASGTVTPSSTPVPRAAAVVGDEGAGDDPVAATRQLLQARAGCLRGRVASCLAGVDQDDSAAMDNDTRIIRSRGGTSSSPQAGDTGASEDLLFPIAGATLVERLGDGALVSVTLPGSGTAPVSVLVVRTGSGWRIRDVLVG